MVALVILAASLVAFYSFLSTTLNGADRVDEASLAYDRQVNALELASTLNPMEHPQGIFNLGSYAIRWTSEVMDPPRQSSGYPAGRGSFMVALYRVTLSFPGSAVAPVAVTRVGYRKLSSTSPISASPPR